MTPEQLRKAVAEGIISQEQFEALNKVQAHASLHSKYGEDLETQMGPQDGSHQEPKAPTSAAEDTKFNDENIRLIGGGNDMFVSLGILLLFVGGFAIVESFFGQNLYLLHAISAVGIWFVAEIVTRQKRMRLASTILALCFVSSITTILGLFVVDSFDLIIPENLTQAFGMRAQIGNAGLTFFLSAILASAIYFWRFRVPVLSAVIALSLTMIVFQYSVLYVYDGLVESNFAFNGISEFFDFISNTLYIPLICGLIIFAIAVKLDLHDKKRQSIWSDCAFWLHVISAPLLVHPLFILSTGQTLLTAQIEGSGTATILLFSLIFAFIFVALAIDRRSLLIPTLAYFGVLGVAEMAKGAALSAGVPPFALILITIGTLIIIFGAGWQRIRSLTVGQVLPKSWLDTLPEIKISKNS